MYQIKQLCIPYVLRIYIKPKYSSTNSYLIEKYYLSLDAYTNVFAWGL